MTGITREERAEIMAGRMPGWLMTPDDVAKAYEPVISRAEALLRTARDIFVGDCGVEPCASSDAPAERLCADIDAFMKEVG